MMKKHPDVVDAGSDLDFSDLKEDPVVMFQKRLDPWFTLYMCYIFPAQVAQHYWGEEFWTGFYVAGALRYCVVLHFTWLVNSAAHLYGDYPFDYAASEFGISSQFNPSKLLIDFWAAIGFVWGRKRATAAWAMGRARRDQLRKEGKEIKRLEKRPWEDKKQATKVD